MYKKLENVPVAKAKVGDVCVVTQGCGETHYYEEGELVECTFDKYDDDNVCFHGHNHLFSLYQLLEPYEYITIGEL